MCVLTALPHARGSALPCDRSTLRPPDARRCRVPVAKPAHLSEPGTTRGACGVPCRARTRRADATLNTGELLGAAKTFDANGIAETFCARNLKRGGITPPERIRGGLLRSMTDRPAWCEAPGSRSRPASSESQAVRLLSVAHSSPPRRLADAGCRARERTDAAGASFPPPRARSRRCGRSREARTATRRPAVASTDRLTTPARPMLRR